VEGAHWVAVAGDVASWHHFCYGWCAGDSSWVGLCQWKQDMGGSCDLLVALATHSLPRHCCSLLLLLLLLLLWTAMVACSIAALLLSRLMLLVCCGGCVWSNDGCRWWLSVATMMLLMMVVENGCCVSINKVTHY